jgi:hypothetical protein
MAFNSLTYQVLLSTFQTAKMPQGTAFPSKNLEWLRNIVIFLNFGKGKAYFC